MEKSDSVTFQYPKTKKERLEQIALSLGYTRVNNKTGQEEGNMSMLIKRFIEFAFAHLPLFVEWSTEKIKTAMTAENPE